MSDIWTIKGEAGKAMDATVRTLESINAFGAKMTFRNLAADTLTFSIPLASLSSTVEIVPQLGQVVELHHPLFTRYFKGHVTGRRQSGRTITITVSGPWWWLERVFLESTMQDATGASADRATYVFSTQDLRFSLAALVNKAAELGVPMELGTLASTFTAPEMKINQTNFAGAISEVVRITPDMALFFDYNYEPPRLETVRRLPGLLFGSAEPIVLDARTLASFELNPLTELQVTQVRVPYMTRSPAGKKKYATQNAGAAGVGKVMLHTVSGEELDTFLPFDEVLDSVVIKTVPAAVTAEIVRQLDPGISAIAAKYGVGGLGGVNQSSQAWMGAGASAATVSSATWNTFKKVSPGNPQSVVDEAGQAVALSGLHVLIFGDLPAWATLQLGARKVTISGTWYAFCTASTVEALNRKLPAGVLQLPDPGSFGLGRTRRPTGPSDQPDFIYWVQRPFSFQAMLVNLAVPSKKKIWRAPDYSFRFPPEGFAAGLLAAQNYLPYEGRFTVVEDEIGGTRFLERTVNFSNSQPAHASINAMATEQVVDLATGKTSVYLGPPARFSYLELVNRMRTNSNDQIIYV